MTINNEVLESIKQAIVELESDSAELERTISALEERKADIDSDLYALEHFLKRYEPAEAEPSTAEVSSVPYNI